MKTEKRCQTCQYFKRPALANGKPDLRRDSRGVCTFSTTLPAIPQWAQVVGYRDVSRDYGSQCAVWKKRTK